MICLHLIIMSMRGAFFFGGEQTIVWLQDSTSYAPQTMYTSFKLTKSPLLSIQDNQLPSFFIIKHTLLETMSH